MYNISSHVTWTWVQQSHGMGTIVQNEESDMVKTGQSEESEQNKYS